jgi:hypothetical protein
LQRVAHYLFQTILMWVAPRAYGRNREEHGDWEGQHAKKVTAFVGSGRKKHAYSVVVQFLSHLQGMGEFEYVIVRLRSGHRGPVPAG